MRLANVFMVVSVAVGLLACGRELTVGGSAGGGCPWPQGGTSAGGTGGAAGFGGTAGAGGQGGQGGTIDPMWDEAELVLVSPNSGQFVPLGELMPLTAEVQDANGQDTGWDLIYWYTDQDPSAEWLGKDLDVPDFPVGQHTITAKTELPNGDRLTYAVGGVLVQHIYAGVYAGVVNISLDMNWMGTPVTAQCVGSVDFVIEPYGESLDGSGACIASVGGMFDLPLDLLIAGTILPDDTIEGTIGVDVGGLFQIPSAFTGEVPQPGEVVGSFAYDYLSTQLTGEIDAHRVALTP